MPQIKIDCGVPVPESGGRAHGNTPIYPFATMEVGQSFWLEGSDGLRAWAAARSFKYRNRTWNYAIKRERTGLRIWRTA